MKVKIILFAICFLTFFLRIYNLTGIPNSISADEAAFGYNAYSILKTGRDEFGYTLPLSFRSFDDYKNPLYGYLLIPFIQVFGLNDWTIRFPAVLIGTLTIPAFFLLTQRLTDNKRIALFTALLAAISPWLIQYSRVGLEMELALLFSVCGVWSFLKGQTQKYFYLLTAIFFGLSFYTYHSSKLWVLVFFPLLLLITQKMNRYIISAILLLLLIALPYFLLLKTTEIGLRPYAISVFSDKQQIDNDARLILEDKKNQGFAGRLLHNRRLTFLNQATNGYLKILNPSILFAQDYYNQIPSTRLFYLWQLPLIVAGIVYFRRYKKLLTLLVSWTLIAFVPGGMTIYPPYDRRILLSAFPLILFSAAGIFITLKYLTQQNTIVNSLGKISTVLILFFSFFFYLHNYFIHGPTTVVDLWGNGTKELVEKVKTEKEKYDSVIVSIRSNQPLIFFLYYEKYPPEKYLAKGGTVTGGFLEERNKFDRYQFKNITPETLSSKNLYVWGTHEPQPCLQSLHVINKTDGTPLANIGIYQPTLSTACLE